MFFNVFGIGQKHIYVFYCVFMSGSVLFLPSRISSEYISSALLFGKNAPPIAKIRLGTCTFTYKLAALRKLILFLFIGHLFLNIFIYANIQYNMYIRAQMLSIIYITTLHIKF